jgi:beta-glucosidase
MQLPKDMKTVERQMEDLSRDMECYKDSDNNRYNFAYGLNWSGQIDDNRVKKYR